MTEITLTRLLSEIKTIEENLNRFPTIAALGSNKSNKVDNEHSTIPEFSVESQSRFDKWMALQTKLIAYKAARNKANVTTMVTVAGVVMSMDTAIAKKAITPVLQAAVQNFKQQISNIDKAVVKADNEVNAAIDKSTNTAASAGQVTSDQMNVFRTMYEQQLGKTLVVGANIKTAIVNLETYIAEFTAEIDYVLSEANATTKVSV
jgi:hypothetical protein